MELVYYRLLSERNPDLRAALTEETCEIARQILHHSEAAEPIKLGARLRSIDTAKSDLTASRPFSRASAGLLARSLAITANVVELKAASHASERKIIMYKTPKTNIAPSYDVVNETAAA